jgi:hypothetical protein
MADIVEYMVKRHWAVDQKSQRKRYLHKLARKSRTDPDVASKIGGMLIYNQVIEQYLFDIVDMSIHYIKAEIYPVQIALDVELDKATFGKVIDYFTQYATMEPNRDLILSHLKKFNSKRNQVVHDLFDIRDMDTLGRELDKYAALADEIIELLAKYDDQIYDNFSRLEQKMDFRKFLV